MKILIITNKLPYPPKDGGSIATLNLALGLANYASKIDILAINTLKHYFDITKIPSEISQKITFYDLFADTTINPIKLLKNFIFSRKPYNAERFIIKEFEQKIIDLLKANNYDIIQLEGLYVLPYIPVIRKYSRALISYRAHNVEYIIWERTAQFTNNIAKKIYIKNLASRIKKFEIALLNKYDLLVAISQKDHQILNKLGNYKPSITIPTGFDISENIELSNSYEFPSLFFIGALDWTPNQEGLVWFFDYCWAKIAQQMPNLKLYLAGRNAPDWLVKIFKQKNVVYLGEIANAREYMLSKAIMIAPLFSGSGMRVKLIEAMLLGKTIVTTTIGAEGIDVTDGKEIFIADTPEKFVDTIITLTQNPKIVEQTGKQAQKFVYQNYDNQKISRQLFDFYQQQIKILC